MTQDEIIKMAKQFGMTVELASHPAVKQLINEVIKQTENNFMQLFLDPENQPTQFGTATQEYRDKEIKEERERTIWTQKHWTEYEHNLVAAEREACAGVAEQKGITWKARKDINPDNAEKAYMASQFIASAIRARGQTS